MSRLLSNIQQGLCQQRGTAGKHHQMCHPWLLNVSCNILHLAADLRHSPCFLSLSSRLTTWDILNLAHGILAPGHREQVVLPPHMTDRELRARGPCPRSSEWMTDWSRPCRSSLPGWLPPSNTVVVSPLCLLPSHVWSDPAGPCFPLPSFSSAPQTPSVALDHIFRRNTLPPFITIIFFVSKSF